MSTTEWTILEKLLLSQAVYKYGEDNWFQIAKNLKHHALLDRPSDYFNQKNCSHQYYSMVRDINKENSLSNDMPAVVQLARHLYNLRLDELKKAINEDEEKFLSLVAEIDDIRAGKWDNQLLGLSSTSEKDATESNAATPTNERSRRRDDQRNKSWLKNINLLWREIANHKNGAMFMNPIKENIAPHYYEIIINSTIEFERDVVLMLNNSLMYNKEGTEVYQLAKEMLDDAVEQIKVFKMADTDTTASSHTRAATKKSAVPE
ncbi:Bromodomain-containing protein [Parasitella parasitica]|nr:Bromodomain-containing protein [Parasitella parasitica]